VHNFFVVYLRSFTLGFLAGVLLESIAGDFLGPIWLLFFSLAAVFSIWGISSPASRMMALVIGFFLLALTVGLLLTSTAEHAYEVKLPPVNEKGVVSVTGAVADEPDERDRDTRLTFRPDGSRGQLLLVLPTLTNYHYGDRLQVTGKPETPQPFETDLGRTFDYPAYLAARGIGAIMRQPKIERLDEKNSGSMVVGQLFALKFAFLRRLDQVLPEPSSSLLGGLVVGGKRSLGPVWQEQLRRTGLIHLIVLSGYNLTIVGVGVASFFAFLRLRRSLALGGAVLAIILFSIMVGGGASVIRAAIMALIAILARLTGRTYEAGRALVTAMIAMVAINPLILVNDIGFQLSCLATAGLIYGAPLVERWFQFVPTYLGLRSAIITTVAAQLAVLPWILWTMGRVPLYALITNLLVVPIVPFAMFIAAMIGLAGLLISPLAYLLAPLGYVVASYILAVTSTFAALPGASLAIKTFPFILVVLIYAGYFWLWRRYSAPPEGHVLH